MFLAKLWDAKQNPLVDVNASINNLLTIPILFTAWYPQGQIKRGFDSIKLLQIMNKVFFEAQFSQSKTFVSFKLPFIYSRFK